MDILSEIIKNKIVEVNERKSLYPIKLLEKSIYYTTKAVSLKKYLLREDKSGIIAEFKTKSPSKGDINTNVEVEKVSIDYMQAGASALSILTDQKYFGGSTKNLIQARKYNYCPILQKDFFVDEYQVIEAKSVGADAILLIAAVLSKTQLKSLAILANSLGLEVLFEVHSVDELIKLNEYVDIVGINNRNLKTFETNIYQSIELAKIIPSNYLKISESGIYNAKDILCLKKHGYQGFLIGEHFMRTANPGRACRELIGNIQQLENELSTKDLALCK